jgi:hypothetical protein
MLLLSIVVAVLLFLNMRWGDRYADWLGLQGYNAAACKECDHAVSTVIEGIDTRLQP